MKRNILFIFSLLLLLTACGTYQHFDTSEFVKLEHPDMIDGTYFNRESFGRQRPSQLLDYVKKRGWFDANFVDVKHLSKDKIEITYKKDSLVKHIVLDGEMKKKYFEVYFQKEQIFIPLLFSSFNVDRIRIGKNNKDELLLHGFESNCGNLLILAAGGEHQYTCRFMKPQNYNGLYPYTEKGRWGYADSLRHVRIQPQYKVADEFIDGVAIVGKDDNTWWVIDEQGNQISDYQYDFLESFQSVDGKIVAFAVRDHKSGLINTSGKEILPCIYEINDTFQNGVCIIKLDDKYGFADAHGLLIPPIYSKVLMYDGDYAVVYRGEIDSVLNIV